MDWFCWRHRNTIQAPAFFLNFGEPKITRKGDSTLRFRSIRSNEYNGIEAHVMHSTSIPVKRDHRRAKTDRLDCQMMMRAFLGWLRSEEGHCRMVAVPTVRQEDGVDYRKGRNTTLRISPVPFHDVENGCFTNLEVSGDPAVTPAFFGGLNDFGSDLV